MAASDGANLWTTPAAQPPAGQTSDFSSRLSEAPLFYVVTSVAMGIATLCVVVKLYVRMVIHKQLGLDDLCLCIALALLIGFAAINDVVFAGGGGRHQYDMSKDTYTWVSKRQSDGTTIQMLAYLFTKLALLMLYYRLFNAKPAFKWSIIAGGGVLWSAYLSFMFMFAFVRDDDVLLQTNYGMGWFDLISDVYLWALPLAAVSGLTMPRNRKVGLAVLFSIGALACAMSALSLTYRLNVGNLTDWTWEYPRCNTVIAVEICVGIVIACVPVFPILLRTKKAGTRTWSFSKAFKPIRRRVGTGKKHSGAAKSKAAKGKGIGSSASDSRVASAMFSGGRGGYQQQDDTAWPLAEYRSPSGQLDGSDDDAGDTVSSRDERVDADLGDGTLTLWLSMDSLYEPSRCSDGEGGGRDDMEAPDVGEAWRGTGQGVEVSPV